MFLKIFLVFFSLFTLLAVLPKNIYVIATPAATSCINTGGNIETIYENGIPTSGICLYPLGFQCADYQFYQTNECTAMILFFGSLNSLPTQIIFLLIALLLVYFLYKRFKYPVRGRKI